MSDAPLKPGLRFERNVRLLGRPAAGRLRAARVTVFGLGGVGSYAVEGLARAGVGELVLVDFDRLCITNFNRQIHAVEGAVGRYKADLMAERVLAIDPSCRARPVRAFYEAGTAEDLLPAGGDAPDLVLDCIDNVTAKLHLLATCLRRGLPVVSSLGSAGRTDPTRVASAPLDETAGDPLGKAVRKNLRRVHGVTDAAMARVRAVYSSEPVTFPQEDGADLACGVDCVCPGGKDKPHSCDRRHVIHGSLAVVTGVFGLVAAAEALRILAAGAGEAPAAGADA